MKLNLSESYKLRIQELANIRSPKIPDETYFETLSAALQHAVDKARERGYEVDETDQFHFGFGGISYGQYKKADMELTKNGIPQKKRLQIQMYRMDSGKYELNYYIQ